MKKTVAVVPLSAAIIRRFAPAEHELLVNETRREIDTKGGKGMRF